MEVSLELRLLHCSLVGEHQWFGERSGMRDETIKRTVFNSGSQWYLDFGVKGDYILPCPQAVYP